MSAVEPPLLDLKVPPFIKQEPHGRCWSTGPACALVPGFRKLNWSSRQKKQKKRQNQLVLPVLLCGLQVLGGMVYFFFAQVFHLSITPLIAELSPTLLLNLN